MGRVHGAHLPCDRAEECGGNRVVSGVREVGAYARHPHLTDGRNCRTKARSVT
nr:MAG TPA: hypothetical protein [Caudoviricetes sp.]